MFIELPILLQQNDPDDEIDYEALNINADYPIIPEMCLINVRDIQRVNKSNMDDYKTVLWTFDGGSYHTSLEYHEVREMILSVSKSQNKCS